jgi:hypothetical protein
MNTAILHIVDGDISKIKSFEYTIEKQIIHITSMVGITASVKTNKQSLPHQYEIISVCSYLDYINDAYDYRQFIRQVMWELLNKEITKIRFYVLVEVDENALKYILRYYIHA